MTILAQPDFSPFDKGSKGHYVVPEVSFYGAIFTGFALVVLWWRRARKD